MIEKEIINDLDLIIAYADGLKEKALELRKKLERHNGSTSRKRAISDREIAKVLSERKNFLTKKTNKVKGGG
jgi:hypothetical protein